MANKIAGIISDVARYDTLPILKQVVGARFVGMTSAAQPTKRREPPPPRVMTPAEVSADAIKARDQQRRFHEARQVTIPKMQSYLEKQMASGNSKHILDFTVVSVEDFVCFDHLRYIGSLGVSAKKLEDLFEIHFTNQYLDVHEFVECREFNVVRRSKA
jgi:hypothetical protein